MIKDFDLVSDAVLLKIVSDIDNSMTRKNYHDLLVEGGLYEYADLTDPSERLTRLSKCDMIRETLRESDGLIIVKALKNKQKLSPETMRALSIAGIDIEQTIAGELAKPLEEQSRLESELLSQGFDQVHNYFTQSFDNFVQGNYEAANAMTRTALENLIENIASKISVLRSNEAIPQRGRYRNPGDYRNYLKQTNFLDMPEKELLDKFYNYASGNGSHPGISSEAEARLRRFVAIGITLLFLEKVNNTSFMNGLV